MTSRRAFTSCASRAARSIESIALDGSKQETTRLVASMVVSRPPLVQRPLSPFEASYYYYARGIRRALADVFDRAFYFKPGTQAERSFLASQEAPAPSFIQPTSVVSKDDDTLTSLNRCIDRTIYLLVRKKREAGEKGEWQFPQGGIEDADESVLEAARRELAEECGHNMDLFMPSRVPAAVHSYRSKPAMQTMAFLVPARILRGQAEITPQGKKEGLLEFAWLTKEEIAEKVDPELWQIALKSGLLLET